MGLKRVMDEVFLHVCCAPCLATALETLRHEDSGGRFPPVGRIFFYNPNIHPLLEFRRRVKALRVYLERDPVSAEIDEQYGLRDFLSRMAEAVREGADRRERCRRCYEMRLGRAAGRAGESGFGAFSTTLLASREQDRDMVAEVGREAAKRAGIAFVEGDLRRFVPDEKLLRGIYKQQYCGCVFSEEERYRNTGKHIYFSENPRSDGKGSPLSGVSRDGVEG